MQHEANIKDVKHLKCFGASPSQMRSVSMHEIANSRPSIQTDKITRYASPNRFDVRLAPSSFLDSYRIHRYGNNHGVNFSRSKLRSTLPTSFSSYAVPSVNEVTCSVHNSKSLEMSAMRSKKEVSVESGEKFCDKYISSLRANEAATRTSPVNYENNDQCHKCVKHSTHQLINIHSNNNNNNYDNNTTYHNSNSSVKNSQQPQPHHHHHHQPIPINSSSLIYSSPSLSSPSPSPSSTIYTNESSIIVHQNLHLNNQHDDYLSYKQGSTNCTMPTSQSYSEVSKFNLSSNQYSATSQSITTNISTTNNTTTGNIMPNDANHDRLVVGNNSSLSNCYTSVPNELKQTNDKHHSHMNYNSCNQLSNTHPRDNLSNTEQQQIEINKTNKITAKSITFLNHKQSTVNLHNNLNKDNDNHNNLNNNHNNCSALIQNKQIIYPFKTHSFRSIKNKHKNQMKNINRQHQHQQQVKMNDENLINLKPEIRLIDSRPRTRLYIQSGIKTHTKTMTLQKHFISNDQYADNLHSNSTNFITLTNPYTTTRKGIHNLPTSPSMPLPNTTSIDHSTCYNLNLSEIDYYYSEPYHSTSSTCDTFMEYKQQPTDQFIIDHQQNDPILTEKLDEIACEIGLLHHHKGTTTTTTTTATTATRSRGYESSQSSQYDIDGLVSTISSCSESNLPKTTLNQQALTMKISTIISNPIYVNSYTTKNNITNHEINHESTSFLTTSPKIVDTRHRTHLSRIDSSLSSNVDKIQLHSRPNSTGSQIIQKFLLRHLSPKFRHSLSRLSSSRRRKKYEQSNLNQDIIENLHSFSSTFERCKSERYSSPRKSLLRFIPHCSSRSKEHKQKQRPTTEANTTSSCSLNNNTSIIKCNTNKSTLEDEQQKSNLSNTTMMIQQPFPSPSCNHHHHHHRRRGNQYYSRYYYENDYHLNEQPKSRPISIALPIEQNEFTLSTTWNQLQPTDDQFTTTQLIEKTENLHQSSSNDHHQEPTYLNAALNAFGYGCKPDWKHFCVSPSARRLAHARQSMKMKQINDNNNNNNNDNDLSNTTLSNNNNNNDNATSENINHDNKHEQNESKISDETCAGNKLQQATTEYDCDNETIQLDHTAMNEKQSIAADKLSDEEHSLNEQPTDESTSNDLNAVNKEFIETETNPLSLNHNNTNDSSDEQNTNPHKINHSNSYLSAIKSTTPPIKRRNTAAAVIKAKSTIARRKQSLNRFFMPAAPVSCRRYDNKVLTMTNEYDSMPMMNRKAELTTLYENEQNSPTDRNITATTTTTTTTTTDTTTDFHENTQLLHKRSLSANELCNHSTIANTDNSNNNNNNNNSNNPFERIDYIKNFPRKIYSSFDLLTISHEIDWVLNLLKIVHLFEYQLMNIMNLAKQLIEQNNHLTNDNLIELTNTTDNDNNNLTNNELLASIGHIQMLINGNLTTLCKLCRIYLQSNSTNKNLQPLDCYHYSHSHSHSYHYYIPLKIDLEGYWNLILLQYKHLQSQFPTIMNWISNDFQMKLQIIYDECFKDSSNELMNSSILVGNKENRKKNSMKQTMSQKKLNKLSGVNQKNLDKSPTPTTTTSSSSQLRTLIRQQKLQHHALKQNVLFTKQQEELTLTNTNTDTGDHYLPNKTLHIFIPFK
ncbi:unnamed protein product [Schistosoma turkestanicum]|nr:unnamed protein product [Schistosoma turkestanicum]